MIEDQPSKGEKTCSGTKMSTQMGGSEQWKLLPQGHWGFLVIRGEQREQVDETQGEDKSRGMWQEEPARQRGEGVVVETLGT